MKNTDEYISTKLQSEPLNEQFKLGVLLYNLGIQSVFYGKKWIIYIILGLLPLFFAGISADPLFGEENVELAFTSTFIGEFYLFLFAIGSLLISLTVSSDEISDHQIELYLVRPIRRDVLWTSRWAIVTTWIFLVNAFLALSYFIFYQVFNPDGAFDGFGDNLSLLANSLLLIALLTMIYSGLYLFVGFLGNRGFTLGVLIAVIESFFISLLFLSNSPGIPRTHYLNFADELLGEWYTYTDLPDDLTLFDSFLYIAAFMVFFFLLGGLYLRRKEFN